MSAAARGSGAHVGPTDDEIDLVPNNESPGGRQTQQHPVAKEATVNPRTAFLQTKMLEREWSLLDFANEAALDYKTVQNYVKGGRAYNSTVHKIAKSLGIRVDEIPE